MENEAKESKESEQYFDHTPKPINDPDCEHDFETYSTDKEFIYERCKKCPVGRRRVNE